MSRRLLAAVCVCLLPIGLAVAEDRFDGTIQKLIWEKKLLIVRIDGKDRPIAISKEVEILDKDGQKVDVLYRDERKHEPELIKRCKAGNRVRVIFRDDKSKKEPDIAVYPASKFKE